MTTTEPDTRKARREASDRRMLRAATALISKGGIAGAKLAQIGVDAGYSPNLPVQRFGTKLALLEAVLDGIEERFLRHVEARVGTRRGAEALAERIRLQLEAVRDMPESAVALYHLIIESTGSMPDLRPRVARLQRAYHDNLRLYLEQAALAGELAPETDIDRAARVISGAIGGMSMQAIVEDRTRALGDDAEALASHLLAPILAR
ncbi:TetR family transcriptional regulator [Maritimibacter sp. UBA3975]|uniref:TetR/AcrR family transcriptional regulator n=1 Tax=Maritimibacter sp. UBA3975 TaxID=1946833 RepID=UPI000C0A1554|nr:TetR family transcriptional regulator [Maritimibacter sp. UBA3975]MAM62192.1 TetR family transcriptional regulator [Maritimibacter sp.]|tara:strand:- start:2287 stop:2904 length:618 start_codon:yes stop_codon:yes gene_type:complete